MSTKYGPKLVTNGLVLYLDAANIKSHPRSGTNWFDLSASTNNLTTTDCTFNTDKGGNLVFNGSSSYANRSPINVSYVTVNCWVSYSEFYSDSAGHAIISNCDNATSGYMLYQNVASPYNKARMLVKTVDDIIVCISSELDTSTWYNISASYDGTWATIYLNGQYNNKNNISTPGPIQNSSFDFLVGSTYLSGNAKFHGNIAVVQVYNRVLTAVEIKQNYDALKSRFGK